MSSQIQNVRANVMMDGIHGIHQMIGFVLVGKELKGDFVKERAARRGGSGSPVHIKEVDVLLAWWKDNVQPLAGSTPVPRKFRR